MDASKEKLELHFKYCAFIAAMTVIAIATEKWSSSPAFTTFLSNAATMTSLLLGVVAIFYSFVSNDSMSRSLGSITTITSEVGAVRDEINDFVDLTKQATASSAANTKSVQEASTTLTSSLGTLQTTLSAISSQNETLRELMSNLPGKIDQLDAKVGDFVKASGEKPQQSQSPSTPTDISSRGVQRFLERSTLSQNLLVIACVFAHENGKELSVDSFNKAIEWDAPNQITGYLSCMHAVQLCSRKAVEGKSRTHTIINVHPELIAQAKPYYESYISDNFAKGSEDHQKWINRLSNVEQLFIQGNAN